MYLTEYQNGDINAIDSSVPEYLKDAYEEDPDIYLRTFRDEEGTPVVIGMCAKTGEIGLIQSGSVRLDAKEFYTLVVVFCAEGFSHSNADRLFTGFDPTSPSNMRWCKFLRMQKADEQIDEHLIRGWITYEFPLSNWVR